MNILSRIDHGLAWLESAIIVALCSVALVLGVLQVFLRYVLNTGFHWNEAVFVTLTIWAMLIGGSRAIRDGLHPRVEIIANILPERAVHFCNLIALFSAFALSALFMVCGFFYTRFVNSMGIADIDSGVPDAITYAIVPIAMFVFIIRYFIKIVHWFRDPGEYSRMVHIDHG